MGRVFMEKERGADKRLHEKEREKEGKHGKNAVHSLLSRRLYRPT
jgi:hypothetical protein